MDVLVAGFVLGAGATWLARRRRRQVRDAIAWTARQSGWISGQVAAKMAEARRIAREQYEMGRASGETLGHEAPRETATTTLNGSHSAATSATAHFSSPHLSSQRGTNAP
jgi:hypothetical protein